MTVRNTVAVPSTVWIILVEVPTAVIVADDVAVTVPGAVTMRIILEVLVTVATFVTIVNVDEDEVDTTVVVLVAVATAHVSGKTTSLASKVTAPVSAMSCP